MASTDRDEYWERTRDYAAKGAAQAQQVARAKRQCRLLNGSDTYWEAVYTLAVQNEDLAGTRSFTWEG